MNNIKYYKVTNHNEIHHGYAYKDGLNTLDKPFQKTGRCVPGGLYFTTIENIPNFYSYGVNLREVTLPEDDLEFEMVKDNDKYRANKIILGKKYSLYDLETYKKFNLNILNNNCLIDLASENGHINVLNWWKNSGLKLEYSCKALDEASRNGHINVLNWWMNSGFELKYTNDALDLASTNGHVNVLEWWKHSSLNLKHSDDALDLASINGHVNVLEWWKNSGFELKYSDDALVLASVNGHVNVLEWWKNSGLMNDN